MRTNLKTQLDAVQATRERRGASEDERVHVNLAQLVRLQHQATGYSFLPRQPIHSILSGKHASRLRGRGLNFEELRRYQQGDDVRMIDWKVTARTRRPHVRVFSEERDRPVYLVVDQRTHMFFGSQVRMKSVVAAEAAALGAWRTLSQGDRVGALVFNDHSMKKIKAQRSRTAVMQILRTTTNMNRELSAEAPDESNPSQLSHALEQVRRLVKHDALIIVISDFFGADEDVTRRITQIGAHNDVLGVLLVDSMRQHPRAFAGHGYATDGRSQVELNLGSPALMKGLADDYQEEQERIRAALRKMSAPLLAINTVDDVAEQIRNLIGTQAAGIRK